MSSCFVRLGGVKVLWSRVSLSHRHCVVAQGKGEVGHRHVASGIGTVKWSNVAYWYS